MLLNPQAPAHHDNNFHGLQMGFSGGQARANLDDPEALLQAAGLKETPTQPLLSLGRAVFTTLRNLFCGAVRRMDDPGNAACRQAKAAEVKALASEYDKAFCAAAAADRRTIYNHLAL